MCKLARAALLLLLLKQGANDKVLMYGHSDSKQKLTTPVQSMRHLIFQIPTRLQGPSSKLSLGEYLVSMQTSVPNLTFTIYLVNPDTTGSSTTATRIIHVT
jgi:hypothetical protein